MNITLTTTLMVTLVPQSTQKNMLSIWSIGQNVVWCGWTRHRTATSLPHTSQFYHNNTTIRKSKKSTQKRTHIHSNIAVRFDVEHVRLIYTHYKIKTMFGCAWLTRTLEMATAYGRVTHTHTFREGTHSPAISLPWATWRFPAATGIISEQQQQHGRF